MPKPKVIKIKDFTGTTNGRVRFEMSWRQRIIFLFRGVVDDTDIYIEAKYLTLNNKEGVDTT